MKTALQMMILAFALILTSCVSHIQTRYYLIDTEPTVKRVKKHLPFIVEVANVNAPSRYQDQMVYRTPGYEVGFYEYSKWAETPADMVRIELINMLEASGLFKQVVPAGIIAAPDLTLRCEIVSFDQEITGDDYFADCELMLELIKRDGGIPAWSYDAKARVKQEGKGKFVAAMSEAVSKAIADAIANMEQARMLPELAAGKGQK